VLTPESQDRVTVSEKNNERKEDKILWSMSALHTVLKEQKLLMSKQ
jgi:hypothetical protein